ncbi:Fe-S cluster assembly protein SufD [bacterium]|nr:Fe-S cluster assembly protein SufD [bacterium]
MRTAAADKTMTYRELFRRTRESEPAWTRYAARREDALDRLVRDGLDVRGREDWVHGDPGALAGGEALPRHGAVASLQAAVLPSLAESHLLVFVDGVFAPDVSRLGDLPDGVVLRSLAAVDETDALGAVLGDDTTGFAALNDVFWRDGLLLDVPAGVTVGRPVELVFVHGPDSGAGVVPVRNVVRVGDRAVVTLVERFAPGRAGIAEQPLTEIVCGAGARVDHVKLVVGEAAGEHAGATHVRQDADSAYRSWEFATGGARVRRELALELAGSGAACVLNALYMGDDDQRFDMRTRVHHAAPGCRTEELYKGILDGRSRGVFDGQILVARDSQQTDAHQTNRNLLLSDDAVMNSIPRLEIYADDVKCSHGSTTGQIEENELFYLQARGFSLEEARTWLAWAFASEVIDAVPVPALREELAAIVTRSLHAVDTSLLGGRG